MEDNEDKMDNIVKLQVQLTKITLHIVFKPLKLLGFVQLRFSNWTCILDDLAGLDDD